MTVACLVVKLHPDIEAMQCASDALDMTDQAPSMLNLGRVVAASPWIIDVAASPWIIDVASAALGDAWSQGARQDG